MRNSGVIKNTVLVIEMEHNVYSHNVKVNRSSFARKIHLIQNIIKGNVLSTKIYLTKTFFYVILYLDIHVKFSKKKTYTMKTKVLLYKYH